MAIYSIDWMTRVLWEYFSAWEGIAEMEMNHCLHEALLLEMMNFLPMIEKLMPSQIPGNIEEA
jgi:hypothetical protein